MRHSNKKPRQCRKIEAWLKHCAGSPSSGSIIMWMPNSDHSDNFGAESETSYLVTATCHRCIDTVRVKLSALKSTVNNCPSLNAKGNFFNYGLRNIFY